MKDLEGRFVLVNPASARRNGFQSPDEIIGKIGHDAHPPQMAAAYREEDRRVIEACKPMAEQIWLVYDCLGKQHGFVSTKIPPPGKSGEVVGLAATVGLSVRQLNRRFKTLFGIAPMQFVLRTRINAARTILSKGGETVGEIALVCGFYDQGQFGRIFKRETGLTPGQYRRPYQSGSFGGVHDAG